MRAKRAPSAISRSLHRIRSGYVGSGEGIQRPDLSTGDGIYKSTDAGKTWRHLGLRDGQQIGGVIVDPRDENRLFVAVLGHPYGPNPERGVYRSTNGGETFERVLYGRNRKRHKLDRSHNPPSLRVAVGRRRGGENCPGTDTERTFKWWMVAPPGVAHQGSQPRLKDRKNRFPIHRAINGHVCHCGSPTLAAFTDLTTPVKRGVAPTPKCECGARVDFAEVKVDHATPT